MVERRVGTAQKGCTNVISLPKAWLIITVNLLLDLLVPERVYLESEACRQLATVSL